MDTSISYESGKEDVANFFSKLCKFGDDIKTNLIKEEISGDILLDLEKQDYVNLGFKLGHIIRITEYLEENKKKFIQSETKESIPIESNLEYFSKLLESNSNNTTILDIKKILDLKVEEMKELKLTLGKKKKLIKFISEIKITKESKKENVAKYLKVKFGFSEKIIESLGLDGKSLFSLKEKRNSRRKKINR